MKLDLKLLAIRFSQAKETLPVSTDGVNPYLLEKILLPCMNDGKVYLRDIDYEAFEVEDIDNLKDYYDKLCRAGRQLGQLAETVWNCPPEAQKARLFC